MKNSFILFFILLVTFNVCTQEITGQWIGLLKNPTTEVRIVLNISKTEKGLISTIDSPDQGARGISVESTIFENSILTIKIPKIRMEFSGELNMEGKISGTFVQNGNSIPLEFTRVTVGKIDDVLRSQEPRMPFSYYSEDVKFFNQQDKINLSGTLTLPDHNGTCPIVVLISGSGAQNRNGEILGHKPFLVISDYLTRNGIGVLRFDDRGTEFSEGDFSSATTEDFSRDVEAAVNYLMSRKDVNKKKIGLIGHSEGGIIAPIVAAKSKNVNFIILLAGTGIKGGDLLLLQQELVAKSLGVSENEIKRSREMNSGAYKIITEIKDTALMKKELNSYCLSFIRKIPPSEKPIGFTNEKIANDYISQYSTNWIQFFIQYDPKLVLKDIKCSVLALNGEKDIQVPSKINLEAIQKEVVKGGNTDVTTKEFPNLNHLFQECVKCTIEEYSQIDQTISPSVLVEISNWILR